MGEMAIDRTMLRSTRSLADLLRKENRPAAQPIVYPGKSRYSAKTAVASAPCNRSAIIKWCSPE
jgi:hypothetical protein